MFSKANSRGLFCNTIVQKKSPGRLISGSFPRTSLMVQNVYEKLTIWLVAVVGSEYNFCPTCRFKITQPILIFLPLDAPTLHSKYYKFIDPKLCHVFAIFQSGFTSLKIISFLCKKIDLLLALIFLHENLDWKCNI